MAKPKIITENVVEPVYQRTVNKPTILRERYVPVPQFVKSAARVSNRQPVVHPTKYTESTNTRTMNIPGNTVTLQEIHKPSLLVQREVLKINQSAPQVMRHPATTEAPRVRQSTTTRTMTIPGATIHRKTIVQPVIEREHVNVQVQNAPDRVINNRPVVQAARVTNKVNTKVVNVPGRTIVTQKHIQPVVNTIRTQVKLVPSPVQRITNKPIFKKPIVTKSSRTVNHSFNYEVPVERVVHVPTPVLYRIPVYLGTQTNMINEGGADLSQFNLGGGQADAEAALLLKGGLLSKNFGSSGDRLNADMMIAQGAEQLEASAYATLNELEDLKEAALEDAEYADEDLDYGYEGDFVGRA